MKKLAIVIIGVWLAVGAALLVWKQYTKGNSTTQQPNNLHSKHSSKLD